MSETDTTPNPDRLRDSSLFLEYERLDCYRLAIDFQAIAARLCSERRLGALRDQLERASVSIALNIAEGVGRRARADKAHFFAIARGSATECAAILEVAASRGLLGVPVQRHGRAQLIRVVQMLTRLMERPARG